MTKAAASFMLGLEYRPIKKEGISMKKDARTKKLLKRLAALRGKERERLPRPAVFEDKKKYRREREKERLRRYDG